MCNVLYAFDMGFGGAGFALSYPLAKALALNMDSCIKRYPFTKGKEVIIYCSLVLLIWEWLSLEKMASIRYIYFFIVNC